MNNIVCINQDKCGLRPFSRNVVQGRGSFPADVLMIGEAPGRSEDALGEAFVGEAGRFLDLMVRRAGLDKYTIYFTNTVWCHPTDRVGGENREPTTDEVLSCMPNVLEVITRACPREIVLVGDIAKRFYRKYVINPICIQHPSFILKTGGINSPYFIKNLHKLEEVCLLLK